METPTTPTAGRPEHHPEWRLRMARIPALFARQHAERIRNLASVFVLAELEGAAPPTPTEMVRVLEEIAVAYESALQMPDDTSPEEQVRLLRTVGAV